ncbi:hypothetical protein Pint_07429 [Pistacia integerrima]|uniref:Uncharacterized protein n=1 Tax=Pistacia integerrima TaxID=434235 RepID=A0ACC0XT67_9ROSI|nr:hypothetical protein Pint_07429 [Pistacia integerrima]
MQAKHSSSRFEMKSDTSLTCSCAAVLYFFLSQNFFDLQEFEPTKVELLEDDEILLLEFSENLPVGMGVLAIGFEGIFFVNNSRANFSQVTQDRLQSEPLSPNRASFISEQNKLHTKDLEDVQTMEETRGASCKPYQIWALYFWHKDVPLYYRIRLCEMVDITICYLMAQFCGEKEFCVGTIEIDILYMNRT